MTGGSANLGFDVLMHIQGDGAFVETYARSALVPHPEGIDAELTPNTYQVTEETDDGTLIHETINAVSLSSTSLTSSANPSFEGESVALTAVVDVKAVEHGPATGKVRFYDGAALLGEGVVSYAGGQFVAAFSTASLGLGTHTIKAVYGGNDAYVASSTQLMHQVVEGENDAPVAVDDSYDTYAGTALAIVAPGVLGNDTDADGDPLTAVKVERPKPWHADAQRRRLVHLHAHGRLCRLRQLYLRGAQWTL